MRNLNVVMPMVGLGSRFAKAGFDTPKPLITVDDMPMFRKAMSSLDNIPVAKKFHFVIRQQHVDEQHLDRLIKEALPEANVIVLQEMTRGAAESALAAKPHLQPDEGVIIMDCDLWFQSDSYRKMVEDSLNDISGIAGGLLTFPADNPRYSYAKFGDDGIVTETAEKRVISPNAITGAYYFATSQLFTDATEQLLTKPISDEMPEYYISHLYNVLIANGGKIQAATVDQFASFGTPEELDAYNHGEQK
jgi:UDP-N-acetylglucosamine diphosphorylase / glucose-1-phosphate thymidylyltransferase / UDP-N-acetylgalactosamine diphosphorylase / glucosamine-1-phosphate N-acetyltransferase / galactosamine-1-phosphate N-acetyltransferase